MAELKDKFGRIHDYLRISLTDKCNLRCQYCMPEHPEFMHNSKLLSKVEIISVAGFFVREYGVNKIRVTGGEPLIRNDAAEIIEELSRLNVRLKITTNGVLLDDYFSLFERIGLTSINISLDSLDPEKNQAITKRNLFEKVMKNIETALVKNFKVKVNMVAMRGVNDDEILDFIRWTKDIPVHVRFIEFMPFDGNNWNWEKVVSFKEMLSRIESAFEIEKLKDKPNSTSKAYRVKGYAGTFAVISSVTAPFCQGCNRIRLTADGKIKNCLFSHEEVDIRTPLREGKDIRSIIEECIKSKHAERGGHAEFNDAEAKIQYEAGRAMVAIGG